MNTRYASRKFIIALLVLASNHWALMESLISGDQYRAITIAILGLYGLANVAQKAIAK